MNYNNEDTDTLKYYYKEIKKWDLLTPEEEVALTLRISEGDDEAMEILVKSNLRFVVSIARQYKDNGVSLADLISEGNYGLIKAAKRFDHTKGFRFISYAVFWIKQSILQFLNECARTIRLPVNVLNKIYQLKKEVNTYNVELSDKQKNNDDYISMFPKCSSINNIINEDGDELLNILNDDVIRDFDQLLKEEDELQCDISDCLIILDERERQILVSYYGLNGNDSLTLEVIGEKYDLTKERVRQIKGKAIQKLRANVPAILKIMV